MADRTLAQHIDALGDGGERPALVQLRDDGDDPAELSYADLAERVLRAARGMAAGDGVRGESIPIFARPGLEWVVACLAVLRSGAVPVPLDTQLEQDDLGRILDDCGARRVLSDRRSAARLDPVLGDRRAALLDDGAEERGSDGDAEGSGHPGWRPEGDDPGDGGLPDPDPDDHALLFYTSGTTGPPKGVPLAHRHLCFQLDVIREAELVGDDDRILLPLPPHHVYPLVVGLLAPLALRLPVVLPHSLTGPQLLRALEEGGATALVGVPRIYRALVDGLERRIDAAPAPLRAALRGGVAGCTLATRHLRLGLGRALLRPLRRRVGPELRVLVSGGSALDPEIAWRLQGLGWDVASGYGLTETAPLLTVNPPGSRRPDSVGRPVRDVEIRIDREARPGAGDEAAEGRDRNLDGDSDGEILARGPGVFDGYLGLEEKTRDSFTGDGWLRTGDLGSLDDDGWLRVSGRKSTLIVTGSGEKIRTEAVEAAYAEDERIEEVGVLEHEEGLVAVVVPSAAARDGGEPDEMLRAALDERAGSLPSHQRIDRFVRSPAPLERTRLGKLRRHRLRERFEELVQGDGDPERQEPMDAQEMAAPDQELLAEPDARAVWELLAERFPDDGLTPDTRPRLDLGLDSLGWLDLGVEVAERTGVELDEERIAEVETVRDLLEAVAEASPGDGAGAGAPLEDPESAIDADEERWLAPLPRPAAALARLLSALNRVLVRVFLRLETRGVEHLPRDGPVVIAPNHTSYLDAFVVAAALPEAVRARAHWAGWTGIAFRNALFRGLSRLARALPVDPERGVSSSLALAGVALARGRHLVWFPEGQRSESGELRRFRPGIGMVLEANGEVPVVAVHIDGTHAAWPVSRRLPRPGRVRVRFGEPEKATALAERGEGDALRDRIASGLRARVREVGERAA